MIALAASGDDADRRPRMTQTDVQLFHRELERVRLRVMLAIERTSPAPDTAARDRISGELARLDAVLAEQRPGSRGHALATRLGLADDDVDLMWTAVALAADPQVMPHAVVLGGSEARRGPSLALHALIADLDGDR